MTCFCRALALAAALAASGLPACVPLPADYTESEWPKTVRLDPAPAQFALRFAPGSSRILPGDLARLRATAASGGIVPSDRVVVAVAGPAFACRGALRRGGCCVAALRHRPEPGAGSWRIRRRGRDPARALPSLAAAVPRLEQAGRRRGRFHEHRFQQFRLRHHGQSRLDGGAAGRSGGAASGWVGGRPARGRPQSTGT